MKKPLIGLTTYGRDEKNAFSLPAQYLESVRRAGAVPFLIAPDETELDEILPMLSGLILTGGGDMNPESYHGDSHETIYMIDDERDQAEINIFIRFCEMGRRILGICPSRLMFERRRFVLCQRVKLLVISYLIGV